MSNHSDAQAVVDVTLAAAEPNLLDPTQRYAVVVPPEGTLETIERVPDSELDNPRRASGTATVYDVPSLKVLWDKHAAPEVSELFADPEQFVITAVLNADAGNTLAPGHRDHRIAFASRITPAWKAWAALDNKMLDQAMFAEHIESRVIDVITPTGGEMLELAQTFEATTSVDFKSVDIIASGQRALRYEETTNAKAGQAGQIDIPTEFELALVPFEGGDAFKVKARLRYKIRNGNLQLGYALVRPEDVLREAFKARMDEVAEATGSPVLMGVAPPERR